MRTTDRSGAVPSSSHYPDEYGAFDQVPRRRVVPTPSWLPVAVGRLAWLHQVDAESNLRVLDVGSGSGGVALQLAELTNWDVAGLEPDARAAQTAAERGLRVHVGTLDDFDCAAKFDLVLMIHVLEHVHDPVRALQSCRNLLRPGGRVVVAVPNTRSVERLLFGRYWDGWDVPRHLHHFAPRSLVRALSAAGFRPISIQFEWYSLLGRSLANRFRAGLSYRDRSAASWTRMWEIPWGLALALARCSSAMQVVAAPSGSEP